MARALENIDLGELSRTVRDARESKGWTLQQLSHELWAQGFPTSQNKLWRLENRPPKRLDTELLIWLEKVLGVDLMVGVGGKPVLVDDVVALIDAFAEAQGAGEPLPAEPASADLRRVHRALLGLVGAG